VADTAQLMWVGIAAVGGVVRYLDVWLRTGAMPSVGLAFGHAFVSGFAGYMAALTTGRFDPDWAMIAAGAGGYLGTQGLDWISGVLKQRVAQHMGAAPNTTPPKDGNTP